MEPDATGPRVSDATGIREPDATALWEPDGTRLEERVRKTEEKIDAVQEQVLSLTLTPTLRY